MNSKRFTSEQNLIEFSNQHHETSAMQQKRLIAFQQYPELVLPKFQKINYRNWGLLKGQPMPADVSASSNTQSKSMSIDLPANAMITQRGIQSAQVKLNQEALTAGVIALDFFDAQQQFPEWFARDYMTKALAADAHRLAAYHAAAVNCGIFVYVPAGVQLKEPLTWSFSQDPDETVKRVQHVLLIAGENSRLTILESRHESVASIAAANIVEELILEAGAQVHFTAIDETKGVAYLARRAYLSTHARLDWALGLMNDGDVLDDFNVDLKGDSSHTEFKVVAISSGSQTQAITTCVTNYGRHTEGNILQHGVILSDATLIFNGVGHIVKGARDSDAQQENRVLMLSKTARGDANPILLIDENDVRAGHAASVGRVDVSQMYYLMSRGLSKDVAERLVIRGFIGSVLAEIPLATARQKLTGTIERKLIDGQRHRDRTK
ncbi:Fe-S cluster assembly protein SufD [Lapidilactobacillus concavus]|uniref:Fe-S cluster assembly protein SufD n=1 Tax=Lapidilactobacillus concavus TaxID=287844 RepID=UPI00070D6FE4|nr:Fe-S cluster assembly protein SufD [Lapidilactobacillus concavus]GEL13210.1 Fe-S cluster assembly protein SufD [Lapidilactobacillus concavus]